MASEDLAPAAQMPMSDDSRLHCSDEQSQHLAYWLKYLDGIPPRLEVPTDHPYSAKQEYQHAREKFVLADELVRHLRGTAQRMETKLFEVLLATFQILLYRYTGQEDLVLGLHTSDDDLVETYQSAVEQLEHMVLLRVNLADELSFHEFLRSVHAQVLEVQAHQEVPFALLAQKMGENANAILHQ